MPNGDKWYDAAGHVRPHSGAEKLSDGKVRLRSGRVVDQNTYDRFAGPLEVTVVAGPRKTALVFVLDQYGLPWTWETPEGILEERLRVFDERVYKQFLRDHPPDREMAVPARPHAGTMGKPSAGESGGSSSATASGETPAEVRGDTTHVSATTWRATLDKYRYPVDLKRFPGADYPGWFELNICPGDSLQTIGFETRFRDQARDRRQAWAEVVFWKLYSGGLGIARKWATELLSPTVRPAELWSRCNEYIRERPERRRAAFEALREKLPFKTGVAVTATFPAFICPEKFPMVDVHVARWVKEHGDRHGYIGNVADVPNGRVLDSHWSFVNSWIEFCQLKARSLSREPGPKWRARDVEMAVFTAQRCGLELES